MYDRRVRTPVIHGYVYFCIIGMMDSCLPYDGVDTMASFFDSASFFVNNNSNTTSVELGSLSVTSKIYGGKKNNDGTTSDEETPPLLLMTIQGNNSNSDNDNDNSILVYTHADIQPYTSTDWTTTMGNPLETERITDEVKDRLYGRGTTDDKYALSVILIAIQTLIDMGLSYPTVHILVETEEESGSANLNGYLDEILIDLPNPPDVVYVLDAGGPDNSHFWNTRTTRGFVSANLKVEILESTLHSGSAGIVPSPFRIMNNIITERIVHSNGTIIAPPFIYHPTKEEEASSIQFVEALGESVYNGLPWIAGTSPMPDATMIPTTEDTAEMYIRKNLQAALVNIGWDHNVMPDLGMGGNVIQPYIDVLISIRTSPYTNVNTAFDELKELVETPPHLYGVNVTLTPVTLVPGFAASPFPDWYVDIFNTAAVQVYDGKPMLDNGVGGYIGFLSMIQQKLGDKSFIHCTGLFDGSSNGHAPDESLDVDAVKKFTSVLTYAIHKISETNFTPTATATATATQPQQQQQQQQHNGKTDDNGQDMMGENGDDSSKGEESSGTKPSSIPSLLTLITMLVGGVLTSGLTESLY